jgi:hypothetical protein
MRLWHSEHCENRIIGYLSIFLNFPFTRIQSLRTKFWTENLKVRDLFKQTCV